MVGLTRIALGQVGAAGLAPLQLTRNTPPVVQIDVVPFAPNARCCRLTARDAVGDVSAVDALPLAREEPNVAFGARRTLACDTMLRAFLALSVLQKGVLLTLRTCGAGCVTHIAQRQVALWG